MWIIDMIIYIVALNAELKNALDFYERKENYIYIILYFRTYT